MTTNSSLFRAFAGVLLGYVALASAGLLISKATFSAFTTDELFEPANFVPRPLFIAITIVAALVVASLAGWLCRFVAERRRPALVFAAIVGILSFFMALIAISVPNDSPDPRLGGEAMELVQRQMIAQQPRWLTLLQPLLLVLGILAGSHRQRVKS